MKQVIILFLIFTSFIIFGQDLKLTDGEIQQKLDSIKTEGNLLFSMENASWQSSDMIKENKKIFERLGAYLTYRSNDTVRTVFLNKDQNLIIAEYSFKKDSKKPIKEKFAGRNLNQTEIALKNVRSKLISHSRKDCN